MSLKTSLYLLKDHNPGNAGRVCDRVRTRKRAFGPRCVPRVSDLEMVTGGTFGGDSETDRRVRSVKVTVPRSATRLQEFLRAYYYR